jgi:AraC-like DNA-binding protein
MRRSPGKPPDRLYIDHLIYSFTLRLFSLRQHGQYTYMPQGALPAHKLRRVIERMDADLDIDLDLKTIAAESGYSRVHFLRMFRAATDSSIFSATAYREGPIVDEKPIPKNDRYRRILKLYESVTVFSCIQAACRGYTTAVPS